MTFSMMTGNGAECSFLFHNSAKRMSSSKLFKNNSIEFLDPLSKVVLSFLRKETYCIYVFYPNPNEVGVKAKLAEGISFSSRRNLICFLVS